jgi:phosphatidate cytidylyltransferase
LWAEHIGSHADDADPRLQRGGAEFQAAVIPVTVTQASDVLQCVVGKLAGRHPIAPNVSPNKTVEGLCGRRRSRQPAGRQPIYWITPFTVPQAGLLALVICLMGFAGGLVMSATKRDGVIKDFGTLLPGHGGILERIDGVCFAALIFFHLTRYFFSAA